MSGLFPFAQPAAGPGEGPIFAYASRPCRVGSRLLPRLKSGGHDPNLWLYRERTLGLLRRYLKLSVEAGRLPSLLGRELFHARVTAYHASTLEDAVIFVHDIASGLKRLDRFAARLILLIALLEYSHGETARLLGCRRRTVVRRFPEALDQLSEIFLEDGLLVRLPVTNLLLGEGCQEGKIDEFPASDSEQGK